MDAAAIAVTTGPLVAPTAAPVTVEEDVQLQVLVPVPAITWAAVGAVAPEVYRAQRVEVEAVEVATVTVMMVVSVDAADAVMAAVLVIAEELVGATPVEALADAVAADVS